MLNALSRRAPAPWSARYRFLDVPAATYPMRVVESAGAPPTGRALVAVHGMAGGWEIWESVAPLLDQRRRLARLDLPWCGAFGHDWRLERSSAADWLARGLEAVPGGVAALVGHSFGTLVILEYLARHGTAGLDAVVLVSPFYVAPPRRFDWEHFRRYTGEPFDRLLEAALAVRFQRRGTDPEVSAIMAHKVRDRIGAMGSVAFLDLLSRTSGFDLRGIDLPVLVLGGEEDFYALPDDCRSLAAALPCGEAVILPGCGHFAMLERAELVARQVDSFLSLHVRSE